MGALTEPEAPFTCPDCGIPVESEICHECGGEAEPNGFPGYENDDIHAQAWERHTEQFNGW